ncbi:ABC-type cobalamin/Fe3+-siderophore transport system, ATPase component [Azospira oryzae PS]|uniref:ABC-type cobalamin/Fe3+-siderophore transport system, ATPase component n=1 Tax=Azospira oryzae (strain ATCC BAA-33 / DSM 13638 / PS) TaxID=640081 RepID=G8QFD4_AZOOP|nr:ABC transporter ATP-binding protein [Azospira oryzae]AEV24944.1 ABC-type cobalamin/Fe3+-siderophore transport system, ATPase component [Azospira oryzae PS]
MTALLQASYLTVRIGDREVCRDLELQLQPGERLAILGRNGAGKSTLLSTLAGLRPAQGGEVRLQGRSYGELGPRAAARQRGWMAQTQADAFASSVLETALAGRHPHLGRWDWESGADAELARAALARVGLAGMEQRETPSLSGGERQRLAIATLLTQAPDLYLLDEPLAHLDLSHQITALELFAGLARERGAGVVMVLHDPGLAARYCDRALLLQGDGTWESGPVAEILTAAHLSHLYGHPLREVEDGGSRWFIPC